LGENGFPSPPTMPKQRGNFRWRGGEKKRTRCRLFSGDAELSRDKEPKPSSKNEVGRPRGIGGISGRGTFSGGGRLKTASEFGRAMKDGEAWKGSEKKTIDREEGPISVVEAGEV